MKNWWAISGFICGLLSILLVFIGGVIIGGPLGIFGLIFSIVGINKSNKLCGRGLSIGGIILSIIGLFINLTGFLLIS